MTATSAYSVEVLPDWQLNGNTENEPSTVDYSASPTFIAIIKPPIGLEKRLDLVADFDSELQGLSPETLANYAITSNVATDIQRGYRIAEITDSFSATQKPSESTILEICLTASRRSQVATGIGVISLLKNTLQEILERDL